MPYCSQCGNQVGTGDRYCARCGAPQPAQARVATTPLASITPRTASILCYIPMVGWIASIMVLAADRFRQNQYVRFHAFQGLYLFVAWLIVHQVLRPLLEDSGVNFGVPRILEAIIFFTWILMLVKASREETYALPVIGELAQKSAADR